MAGAAIQGTIGAAAPYAAAGAGMAGRAATRRASPVVRRFRETAEGVVGNVRQRSGSQTGGPQPAGARPAGAQVRAADDPAYRGRRNLDGMMTDEELDTLGVPITDGDRLALTADNADDWQTAKTLRSEEELARSDNPLSATGAVTGAKRLNDIRDAQKSFFTRHVGAMLGDPNVENLTRARRSEIRKEVQNVFRQYIDEGTDPIPGTEVASQAQSIADVATGNAATKADYWAKEIASKVQADGSIDRKAFSSLRSGLGDDMERAFKAGNYELGSNLSQMMEQLDEAFHRTLDGDAAAAISEARMRWRILKALERRRVADPGGEINAQTFQSAYEAVTPRFKRAAGGRERISDFERLMDTMVFLQTKVQPDSGTAQRLLRSLGNRVALDDPATLGALGAGGYFLSN